MNALLIGADIGTQGVKTSCFDHDGTCLATTTIPSQLHRSGPGVVEEDPEFQVASVCDGISACLGQAAADPAAVRAIGIDGQMAGVIGIGADGRNVTPYDSWLDTSCAPYIRRMEETAGAAIIRRTGGPASFNHGPKILWWKQERPRDWRRIAAFVQPSGYAAMRLCGLEARQAFIDHTYLHFSGFADNPRRRWDPGLCRRFAVDPAKLPAIVEPQAVIGELSGPMARRCGLRPGTPVIAGCGDTAASFLACGATRPGICVDVAGTASVFAATTASFGADTRHRILSWGRSATPGLWHPYAYIGGGGMNLEWLRRELAGGMDLAELDRLAAALPPALDHPWFVPHLAGRVAPSRPRLRGAWAGLTWEHGLGHLYRAVQESVALEYALYARVLAEVDPALRIRQVRVTGGGERSRVWNTIKADCLQTEVRCIAASGGAPLGVALLAGFGIGLFKDLERASRAWVRLGERQRPDRRLAGHYGQRLARYQQLLKAQETWSEEQG